MFACSLFFENVLFEMFFETLWISAHTVINTVGSWAKVQMKMGL